MQLNDYEVKHNTYLRTHGADCTVLLRKSGAFPLQAPCTIALYGNGARHTIMGGTGSGEVNTRYFITAEQGLKNAGFTITTGKWLKRYDAVVRKSHKGFISSVIREAEEQGVAPFMYGMGKTMPEPEYSIPLNGRGDICVYVLARNSGEGTDRSVKKGDYLLTDSERRDILACAEKYEKFMLVLNVGGPISLDGLDDVKDILLLSQLGAETGNILADILLGKSNPSGKLSTTWADPAEACPAMEFGTRDTVRYGEGIYVGYRYFDTVEHLGIKSVARLPFGFGLSYTEFSVEEPSVCVSGDLVRVSVTVSNRGKYPGRETLQLYVSIPSGRLDEPYQVLAAFTKTALLNGGESDTVSLTFHMGDIAPYDGEKQAYILEEGDYLLRLGTSSVSTEAVGIIRVKGERPVCRAENVFGETGFADWKPEGRFMSSTAELPVWELAENAIQMPAQMECSPASIAPEIAGMTVEELCDFSIGAYKEVTGLASIIGNAGFSVSGAAGETCLKFREKGIPTLVMADGPAGLRLTKYFKQDENGIYPVGDTMPKTITDYISAWDKLKVKLTAPRAKIGTKVQEQFCTALPIGTAIAQSFDVDFARECGSMVGEEMERFHIQLWLAPALNIHRTLLCGRNFEYYSEDPLISGCMAAAITAGVQSHKGCGVVLKHYFANNQEYNRTHCDSRLSERAAREIYLKGFSICIREAAPKGVMTSFNLVNGTHTAEHRGLIETVLRKESGFEGIVLTDWTIPGYATVKDPIHPATQIYNTVMAGVDLFLPGCRIDYETLLSAVREGKVTRGQLEINCSRLFYMMKELN